jgi:hypothetical protein
VPYRRGYSFHGSLQAVPVLWVYFLASVKAKLCALLILVFYNDSVLKYDAINMAKMVYRLF